MIDEGQERPDILGGEEVSVVLTQRVTVRVPEHGNRAAAAHCFEGSASNATPQKRVNKQIEVPVERGHLFIRDVSLQEHPSTREPALPNLRLLEILRHRQMQLCAGGKPTGDLGQEGPRFSVPKDT